MKGMRHKLVPNKFVQHFPCRSKYVTQSCKRGGHLNVVRYLCSEPQYERILPLEWYKDVFPRLTKLTNVLKDVDLIDGRLFNVNDKSTINDKRLLRRMHHFKALSKEFIGHPSVQEEIMKNVKTSMVGRKCNPPLCFSKSNERDSMVVNTLTKVCNFLNISAQQRKAIRLAICPQVTQHRIWTGALEEILKGLKKELELLNDHSPSNGTLMGKQIVVTCLTFLAETASCKDEETSSWMRPKPSKSADSPSTRKWGEVLEMFSDLIDCLHDEELLSFHVLKLEVMKEGLAQLKDVVVDRDIGYKEVRHHESLVQKKLLKTMGHSSRCLFTLLRYYLHRTIWDMEVEIAGGVCNMGDKDMLCLYMGRIVTSCEERMIWSGIKQLDKTLGLFKFVWETGGAKERLEVQGHLWCVGAESKIVTYRGTLFFIHGIDLSF